MKKIPRCNSQTDLVLRRIFLCLIIAALLFSTINIFIYSGDTMANVFFFNKSDSFMDLFNPIKFSLSENPYDFVDTGAIYPPLSYMIMKGLARALPPAEQLMSAGEMRYTQNGGMLVVVFILLALIPLVLVMSKYSTTMENTVGVISIIFSGPLLYLLERANILLWVPPLLLFFVVGYRSQNKLAKELSLIALAVAAALKIYPAVMGVLLLKNKDYNAAVRCAIYGLLLFLLPFFYYDGLNTFLLFVNNMKHGIQVTTDITYRLDLPATIGGLFNVFGNYQLGIEVGSLISLPVTFILLLYTFLFKDNWKSCLCLVMIAIFYAPFMFYYGAVLYIIPIFLLFQEKDHKWSDIIIAVFLAGTQMLLAYPKEWSVIFPNAISQWGIELCRLCQVGLLCCILIEGSLILIQKVKRVGKAF